MTRRNEFRGLVDSEVLTTSPGDDKWEFFWNTVDPDSVCQYVGLRDRKGVRIFERDILRIRQVYVVREWGDDVTEPSERQVYRKSTSGGWGSYGGSVISEFEIQWTGVVAVTPLLGVHLRSVRVEGQYFDNLKGSVRDICDEESDRPFLVSSRRKFKVDSEREVLGSELTASWRPEDPSVLIQPSLFPVSQDAFEASADA